MTPVDAGSITVNPTQNTTYTATVTGATGSVNCQASVQIVPVVETPQCVFLRADKTNVFAGETVTLSWEVRGVDSIVINGETKQGATGSFTVTPTASTTYTGIIPGGTPSAPCTAAVTIKDRPVTSQPQCLFLNASATRITSGQEVTLNWGKQNAASITIAEGSNVVGTFTSDTGSTKVYPTQNTTYTAVVPGQVLQTGCQVRVEIESTTCTSNCGGGGGGGGGRRSPRVVLDSFVPELEEPLAFVYLSEVPYTGLDLGPYGTVVYWLMLIGWSAAAAYLVLFNALPFAAARVRSFGGKVKDALNSDTGHADGHGSHGHVAHSAHASSDHGHAPAAHSTHAPAAPAKPQGYNAHDGFRSFAAGDGLTIDDIVKGLSREVEQKHAVAHTAPAPTHEEVLQAVHHEAPAPVAAPIAYAAPAAAPAKAAEPISEGVRDFIKALLDGDRDTVFGTVRKLAREGQDTELFVSHAACALDDAYRACIDGTTCHPDIAELTNGCHPSFLERIVQSLSGAVDGSYSSGMTGVKMALTRALGVVNG